MARSRKTVDVADSYAVRLMQHLVVPTFVIDPQRRVVIWNRACERPSSCGPIAARTDFQPSQVAGPADAEVHPTEGSTAFGFANG
ncbi:PAS domain-containing protein [Bradyrhizobium forestalis]|uniref:PAS domain-containing protein n=1 Tax=Bradyrhizobium forestalis TaxID=1419263 RepID=UPI001FE0A38D|nr:PAS domain-containing protein [Bradyrhizobium forestalis]